MATRTVTDCDRCDKKAVDTKNVCLATGREMDAAGSMETRHDDVDLCFDCLFKEFAVLAKEFTMDRAKDWVRDVKNRKKTIATTKNI